MYPTPPKALSATRAHRKEKGEGGKEKGNDAPPTRWPPEDFFGIPPPPPLFLSPSFLLCTTHPLPSSQDKTTHTTREQRKGKGKDERKRGKDEGPTRRRPPKELFWTLPHLPLSLSLSLYSPPTTIITGQDNTLRVCFFVSIQLKSRKNMSSQARQFCPKSFLVHFLLFHLRF